MNVTPLDIQQKRFHVALRGYDRAEVETFLDQVRDEMEALVREVTELREFRETYDQRVRELAEKEEAVKNTMLLTQKLVEELKGSARKETELIIKEAEARSRQIIGEAQAENIRLSSDIRELKRRKHHFLQDIKKVIQMHLEMVGFEEGSDVNESPVQK
jgi:cell division initiation protein